MALHNDLQYRVAGETGEVLNSFKCLGSTSADDGELGTYLTNGVQDVWKN